MDLEKELKRVKPNASDITITTYINNLKNLHKVIKGTKEFDNLDFLKDKEKVVDAIEEKSKHTKKNYLVGVIVALQTIEKNEELMDFYNEIIKQLQTEIVNNYDKNEKSKKQQQNWLKHEEVLKLLRKLKKETLPLLDKPKEELTTKEKDLIQQYLILYLYSGRAIPPLRNDYAEMEIVNESDKKEPDRNYLVIRQKGHPYFLLNEFKTKKYKGEQKIIIKDLELKKLIRQWNKITDIDYLLVNLSDNTPMTANGITKYLNKIFLKHFGKKVSTSLLRSIYITSKYANGNMTIEDKKKLAEEMLHSKNISESVYNKIDKKV
jgi:hypothetical protein